MLILGRILRNSTIGLAGCLLLLLVLACFLAVNVALVALVWNTFGLHLVFGAGTLSAVQCIAVAVVLGLFGV